MIHLSYIFYLGLIALLLRELSTRRRRKARALPPGPRSLITPTTVAPWILFDKLKRRYGTIFSFFRGPTLVIVISNIRIACDLLQKRGDIYSSRPRLLIAHDIVSGGMRGLTMPYGKQWRTWRKIQTIGLTGRASLQYRQHQTLEAALVLRDIQDTPDRYDYHITRFTASVVMSISYGRRMATLNSEVFKRHEQSMIDFQNANVPGNPVELYPALLYLPRFLQWFRHDADKAYKRASELYMELFLDAKQRFESGEAKDCMATRSLEDQAALGLTDLQLAFALSAPFGAGIDTSTGTIEIGLCAILHNPAAARKVQEELDRVVGRDRLPTFDDEPALPYLRAFLKEVLRWHPVGPLGVPHSVTADDEYEGHYIPKGATVIVNIHAIMRDPDVFPDPEAFRPERFLETESEEEDRSRVPQQLHGDFTLPFGFGRRQCPGIQVASQSSFIVHARLLWAYDIEPVRDREGNAVLPDMDAGWVLGGLTRKPQPFGFVVRPRFEAAKAIVEREANEAEKLLQAWPV